MAKRKLEELSELTATPTSQLKFLPDAWAQAPGACSKTEMNGDSGPGRERVLQPHAWA